jgi:hypothetical protein
MARSVKFLAVAAALLPLLSPAALGQGVGSNQINPGAAASDIRNPSSIMPGARASDIRNPSSIVPGAAASDIRQLGVGGASPRATVAPRLSLPRTAIRPQRRRQVERSRRRRAPAVTQRRRQPAVAQRSRRPVAARAARRNDRTISICEGC